MQSRFSVWLARNGRVLPIFKSSLRLDGVRTRFGNVNRRNRAEPSRKLLKPLTPIAQHAHRSMTMISLENVRTHNLKGVSLEIDSRALTVVVGVSGSGKSSLAFDTLYAEGQRRFLETLSSSAQQLIGRFPPPDAERIDGVPPTIGLRQDEMAPNLLASVGTALDLTPLLATLFAKHGRWECPRCSRELTQSTAESVADAIESRSRDTRVLVGFAADALGKTAQERLTMLSAGRFARVVADGALCRTSEASPAKEIYGVVDRITAGKTDRSRIVESIETAFAAGSGTVAALTEDDAGRWQPTWFRQTMSCECGYACAESLDENVLLPTRASGICRLCDGTGAVGDAVCTDCGGSRIGRWGQFCTLEGSSFQEVLLSPVSAWKPLAVDSASGDLLRAIQRRRDRLDELHLGHLSLSRGLATLSSGERLRVRLAGILAADLVDSLIILDEPTAGLHPSEIDTVVAAVRSAVSDGNGVVVVEHSSAFLAAADRIVEIGPDSGSQGGEIVFDGPPEEFASAATQSQVAFTEVFDVENCAEPELSERISIDSLSLRNLGDVAFDIVVGKVTAVTGRSGAGKSTFLAALYEFAKNEIANLQDRESLADDEPSEFARFAQVQMVSEALGTRSPRSCLATQTKALDEIRKLFSSVPEANQRGLTGKHFSFNAAGGGRCQHCRGRGTVEVAMAHLSDLSMTCPRCHGSRYEPEILSVKFRRRSIADVLKMTVDEAVPFFRTEVSIRRRLQPVRDVGLGYLTLGQSLDTLSGGETQRLHLASHLAPASRGPVLFLIDEPARGLHPTDQKTLASVFERLVDVGHTVVMADHSAVLISVAAHMIELVEGQVCETGPPAKIIKNGVGPTALALREIVEIS